MAEYQFLEKNCKGISNEMKHIDYTSQAHEGQCIMSVPMYAVLYDISIVLFHSINTRRMRGDGSHMNFI